jgi:ribonuclease P protein component
MGLSPVVTARPSPGLTRAIDIGRVLSEGRRFSGGRVTVSVLPHEGETHVGFACSRSVGGAVVRNRARRVMREAWREVSSRALEGYWVMVTARPAIVGAGTADVVPGLVAALTASGVIE